LNVEIARKKVTAVMQADITDKVFMPNTVRHFPVNSAKKAKQFQKLKIFIVVLNKLFFLRGFLSVNFWTRFSTRINDQKRY
jgi:hypothetical protein